MNPIMNRYHSCVSAINRCFLMISGLMILAVVGIVLWDIVSRNVFGQPTLWALDTSRFALVFIFFFALAPALESGAHVAVDILYEYLQDGPKRTLLIIAQSIVIVFTLILLFYVYGETRESFEDDGAFPATIPIKMKYVYWIGPVGVLQLLLTGASLLLSNERHNEKASTGIE